MRTLHLTLMFVLLFGITFSGCRRKPDESAAPSPTAPAEEGQATEMDIPEESFQARFETSKGDFIVEVYPEWAPHGAARFKQLVEMGFYDQNRFFRVVPGFVVQWGMNGDPAVQSKWQNNTIPDDPNKVPNEPGTITFATSGPDSRTTQLFINYGNNQSLDAEGFAPFGRVIEGMDVVRSINDEYGQQPNQTQILQRGNEYLNQNFPNLDYIKKAEIVEEKAEPETDGDEQKPSAEKAAEKEKTEKDSSAPSTDGEESSSKSESVTSEEKAAPEETIEEIQ